MNDRYGNPSISDHDPRPAPAATQTSTVAQQRPVAPAAAGLSYVERAAATTARATPAERPRTAAALKQSLVDSMAALNAGEDKSSSDVAGLLTRNKLLNPALHRDLARHSRDLYPLSSGYVVYRSPGDLRWTYQAIGPFLRDASPDGPLAATFPESALDVLSDYSGEYINALDSSFADDLAGLKAEITEIVTDVNPHLDVAFVDRLFGDGRTSMGVSGDSGDRMPVLGLYFSALKSVATSTDLSRGHPLESTLVEVYHSLDPLLSEAEKRLIAERFPASRGMTSREHAARAFAEWSMEKYRMRTGTDKTGRRSEVEDRARSSGVFASVERLLERTGNALSARGFASWEDVFEKAAKGHVADRANVFAVDEEISTKEASRIARLGGLNKLADSIEQYASRAGQGPLTGEAFIRMMRMQLKDERILETLRTAGYYTVEDPGLASSLTLTRSDLVRSEIEQAAAVTPVDVGAAPVTPVSTQAPVRSATPSISHVKATGSRPEPVAARRTAGRLSPVPRPGRAPVIRDVYVHQPAYSLGGMDALPPVVVDNQEMRPDTVIRRITELQTEAAKLQGQRDRARKDSTRASYSRQLVAVQRQLEPLQSGLENYSETHPEAALLVDSFAKNLANRPADRAQSSDALASGKVADFSDLMEETTLMQPGDLSMTKTLNDAPDGAIALYIAPDQAHRMAVEGRMPDNLYYDMGSSLYYIDSDHPQRDTVVAQFATQAARATFADAHARIDRVTGELAGAAGIVPLDRRVHLHAPSGMSEQLARLGAQYDRSTGKYYVDQNNPNRADLEARFNTPEAIEAWAMDRKGTLDADAAKREVAFAVLQDQEKSAESGKGPTGAIAGAAATGGLISGSAALAAGPVGEAVDKAATIAENAAIGAGMAAEYTAKLGVYAAGEAVDDAKQAVGEAVDGAREAVGNAVESLDSATNATAIADRASLGADAAANLTGDAVAQTTAAGGQAMAGLSHAGGAAADAGRLAMEGISTSVTNAAAALNANSGAIGAGFSAAKAEMAKATNSLGGVVDIVKESATGVADIALQSKAAVAIGSMAATAGPGALAGVAVGAGLSIAAYAAKRHAMRKEWTETAKTAPWALEVQQFGQVAGSLYKLEREEGASVLKDKETGEQVFKLETAPGEKAPSARDIMAAAHLDMVVEAAKGGADVPDRVMKSHGLEVVRRGGTEKAIVERTPRLAAVTLARGSADLPVDRTALEKTERLTSGPGGDIAKSAAAWKKSNVAKLAIPETASQSEINAAKGQMQKMPSVVLEGIFERSKGLARAEGRNNNLVVSTAYSKGAMTARQVMDRRTEDYNRAFAQPGPARGRER